MDDGLEADNGKETGAEADDPGEGEDDEDDERLGAVRGQPRPLDRRRGGGRGRHPEFRSLLREVTNRGQDDVALVHGDEVALHGLLELGSRHL